MERHRYKQEAWQKELDLFARTWDKLEADAIAQARDEATAFQASRQGRKGVVQEAKDVRALCGPGCMCVCVCARVCMLLLVVSGLPPSPAERFCVCARVRVTPLGWLAQLLKETHDEARQRIEAAKGRVPNSAWEVLASGVGNPLGPKLFYYNHDTDERVDFATLRIEDCMRVVAENYIARKVTVAKERVRVGGQGRCGSRP